MRGQSLPISPDGRWFEAWPEIARHHLGVAASRTGGEHGCTLSIKQVPGPSRFCGLVLGPGD